MSAFNRIAVIGLGYIGLPTAVAFANQGRKVIGVDTNPAVVAALNQGQAHLAEPQLQQALQQAVRNGKFSATAEVPTAEAFIIAVPTPFDSHHQPDLTAIQQAAAAIAPRLRAGNLVVLESTSPVGTSEQLAEWLRQARPDLRFPEEVHLAYCPERVLPGKIMQELVENDRVIGGLSPQCATQAVALYQIFAQGQCWQTDLRTAEMCKLTENAFRDVNIAFANELSLICDRLNISVWELIRLANHHPRVNILQPGAGVGGHCIAVDPWFIVAQHPDLARLIRTAREVNDIKPQWVIDKVKAAVADCLISQKGDAEQITLACLGLTFKADTDDLRQSPALRICRALAAWHRGKVWAVEPNIAALPPELAGVEKVSLETALQQANIIVLLVDHQAFKARPFQPTPQQWLVDSKGLWQ